MNKDKVFDKPIAKQFEFDEEVASVFDDMLDRSVPYYKESLDLTINFALKYLDENDKVYFTICGSTQELHETYRKGTNLKNILKNASNKLVIPAVIVIKRLDIETMQEIPLGILQLTFSVDSFFKRIGEARTKLKGIEENDNGQGNGSMVK